MADASDATCPDCGADLDGARVCPACGLRIRTADDELTDDAIHAVIDDALSEASSGRFPVSHVVPYSLRLAVALAISIPFGPLSAFVVVSVLGVHPIAIVLVGMAGWIAPAATLARATVPSLVVGRGLLALGVAVMAAPPVVALGRAVVGDSAVADPLIDGSTTMFGSFFLFGAIVLGFGLVVTRVATDKREDWRETDAVGNRFEQR